MQIDKYTISFKSTASKEISRLPKPVVKRVVKAIDNLAQNPRPDGVKKIKGSDENLYRIRVGDYRILYIIDDVIRVVNVNKVGHRKEIYRL